MAVFRKSGATAHAMVIIFLLDQQKIPQKIMSPHRTAVVTGHMNFNPEEKVRKYLYRDLRIY